MVLVARLELAPLGQQQLLEEDLIPVVLLVALLGAHWVLGEGLGLLPLLVLLAVLLVAEALMRLLLLD